MRKTATALLTAAATVALVVPMAAPAHASGSLHGCFPSPAKPYTFISPHTGDLRIAANIYINCQNGSGGEFQVHRQLREADPYSPDDTLNSVITSVKVAAGTTGKVHIATTCRNNEPGKEEVYSRARISNDSTIFWTDWRRSTTVELYC